MRQKLLPILPFALVVVAMQLVGAAQTTLHGNALTQDQSERELVKKIPANVPIKIHIKPEIEHVLKDFQNPNWLRDFRLEVTNTGEKPIYFLNFWLLLRELPNPTGNPIAFDLEYGRREFIIPETKAVPDDPFLKPGDSCTLHIDEKWIRGWEANSVGLSLANPSKLELLFLQLSFGDGSGYQNSEQYPRQRRSLND